MEFFVFFTQKTRDETPEILKYGAGKPLIFRGSNLIILYVYG